MKSVDKSIVFKMVHRSNRLANPYSTIILNIRIHLARNYWLLNWFRQYSQRCDTVNTQFAPFPQNQNVQEAAERQQQSVVGQYGSDTHQFVLGWHVVHLDLGPAKVHESAQHCRAGTSEDGDDS